MVSPKREVYWYTKKKPEIRGLDKDIVTDVVIIEGGMAGLSCAERLAEKGIKAIILERSFVGGGASGKSSGFLTPDSELQLSDLEGEFGAEGAKKLRTFVNGGVERIRKNIKEHNIDCDYQIQDSFFVANSSKSFKDVKDEHVARVKLQYPSILYTKSELKEILNSDSYAGGVRYPDCFGINSYLYCQGLKEILIAKGVAIYEETPVDKIEEGKVACGNFSVHTQNIIVCTDRFLPRLGIEKEGIYHAQTFLAVSKPLSDKEIKRIFPSDLTMVWDTDLIYQYFRIIEKNRLLFGASSILYTFKRNEKADLSPILRKIGRYLSKKFGIKDMDFEYIWPGLIGVSKDLMPILGIDPRFKNVSFVGGATGLPWAAALGSYLADKITDGRKELDSYFDPKRKFPVSDGVQFILSKPLSFMISLGITEYS